MAIIKSILEEKSQTEVKELLKKYKRVIFMMGKKNDLPVNLRLENDELIGIMQITPGEIAEVNFDWKEKFNVDIEKLGNLIDTLEML